MEHIDKAKFDQQTKIWNTFASAPATFPLPYQTPKVSSRGFRPFGIYPHLRNDLYGLSLTLITWVVQFKGGRVGLRSQS